MGGGGAARSKEGKPDLECKTLNTAKHMTPKKHIHSHS